jgi:hypothetical protein
MSMMKHLLGDAKQNSKIKLSICVPCRDMVHSAFMFSLCQMITHNHNAGIMTRLHLHMGSLLVDQREQLVHMALEAESTHILWLDSDMLFPPDTAQKLLRHDKSITAGNYPTRQHPHKTVAYTDVTDWSTYVIVDPTAGLQTVEAVGMGCMLTKIELFKNIAKPWFDTTYLPSTEERIGEDFYLCSKARSAGYEIVIDHEVSSTLKHLGTMAFHHGLVKPGLV